MPEGKTPEGTLSEARETVAIVNQRGLHARASAKFVNAVAKLPETFRVGVS
jgi:phosphocarrier protein